MVDSSVKYPSENTYGPSKDPKAIYGDRTGLLTAPKQLLLGCGHKRDRRISRPNRTLWTNLVTLDMYPESGADILHDLNTYPWPIEDNSFEEIHAYEVVEHLGQQGDWKAFFDFFSEVHRILEPNGFFMATCPAYDAETAWADPGHTRVLTPITLVYLDQEQYKEQIDVKGGWMTDYRYYYKADLKTLQFNITDGMFWFILQKK